MKKNKNRVKITEGTQSLNECVKTALVCTTDLLVPLLNVCSGTSNVIGLVKLLKLYSGADSDASLRETVES